jgi:hypothetical protein
MSDESKPERTGKDPAETADPGGIPGQARGGMATWHDMPDWMTEGDYNEIGGGIIGGEVAGRIAKAGRRRQGRQEPR